MLSRKILIYITSLLVLLELGPDAFAFQTQITTNQNVYKRVTGGAQEGTDFVIVDNLVDFDKFNAGDTVLLIQMKGLKATVDNDASYGTPQDTLGCPGYYEFLIIMSTDVPTRKIQFGRNLINSYDAKGDVQIIRVPSYNSASVEATLTCPAWDTITKVGGVLTMIVGKTLTLNADIDVSGKGNLGGEIYSGTGSCADIAGNNNFLYDAAYLNSGFKGGSLVSRAWINITTDYPILPDYAKGKGGNFNGGGGGNGRFSGGGGGSNYGAGGKGGRESSECGVPQDGGQGGRQIKSTQLVGGIFLGGGGGGSTAGGGTGSDGGHGGGIVIIVCNDIVGNGHSVITDGEHPAVTATGLAGAGGGGAGGSVALYLESFSTESNLTLSAEGGKGGNNAGTFGEGGGGGGGLIWISNISIPANVTRSVAGGAAGTRSGASTATSGATGESLTTFIPVLNGFLFNSIRSSVTNTLTDSICSNQVPPQIIGTVPVGGSGSYTYKWQKKDDSGGPIVDIPSSDVPNYTFSASEADTFFIRRVVTDDMTALEDISKWVKIIVQPAIQFNDIVTNPDTICFNGDPQLIMQGTNDLVVPTTQYMYYLWQTSTNYGASWSVPDTLGKEFDPPAGLQVDTWYRRVVISGRCIDFGGVDSIKVLPLLANNMISVSNDTICFGGDTDLATVAGPTGGLPTDYRYQWEYSATGLDGTWNAVAGETSAIYDPDASVSLTVGNHYYRRKVFSGEMDACRDSSNSVLRKVWPVLTGNTIAADQTIGYDSIPDLLTETATIGGGNGIDYSFLWIKDTLTYPDAPGPNPLDGNNYQPPALRWTMSFLRVASSSACTDTSNSVKIIVHAPITNIISLNNPELDVIYTGQDPGQITGSSPTGGSGIPGDYSYTWYRAVTGNDPTEGDWILIADSTRIHLKPGIMTQTTWFRRDASSPQVNPTSTYRSNYIKVEVLPQLQNYDITAGYVICAGFRPPQVKGEAGLSGGDGNYIYTWQDSTATQPWQNIAGFVKCDSADFKPPVLTLDRWYRRIVYSGKNDCASEISNTSYIMVNPLPVGMVTPMLPPDTICGNVPRQIEITVMGSTSPTWDVVLREKTVTGSRDIALTQNQSTESFTVTPDYSGLTNDSTEFIYSLVSITDANGCLATSMTGSRKLVVWEAPDAVTTGDALVCGPEYTITATPSAGVGTWYNTSGPGSVIFDPDINNPVVKVSVDSVTSAWSEQNVYTFKWKEVNWHCKDSATISVTFYKRTGIADAGDDRDLYTNRYFQRTTLNVVKPLAGTGTWNVSPSVFDPQVLTDTTYLMDNMSGTPEGSQYFFTWKIDNGACHSNVDEFTITVYEMIIPQGFSPNGDGENDVFLIEGLNTDPAANEVTLRIFNAAGSEVFITGNTAGNTWADWTGTDNKGVDLPDGTYYFSLIVKRTGESQKEALKQSGFIIIKRSKN